MFVTYAIIDGMNAFLYFNIKKIIFGVAIPFFSVLLGICIFFLLFSTQEQLEENVQDTTQNQDSAEGKIHSNTSRTFTYTKEELQEIELAKFHSKAQQGMFTSYVFGFTLRAFDPNWIAPTYVYKQDGLDVYISQAECKSDVQEVIGIKTTQCQEEKDNREYPPYAVSQMIVTASIYAPESETEFFNGSENFIKEPQFTPKKRPYSLSVNNDTTFIFTFYSKNPLTSFGSPQLFAFGKYDLTINRQSDIVSDEKIITLGEKVIDAVEFHEQEYSFY